jgi:hypothetical protein
VRRRIGGKWEEGRRVKGEGCEGDRRAISEGREDDRGKDELWLKRKG